jgi:hypothetical protein
MTNFKAIPCIPFAHTIAAAGAPHAVACDHQTPEKKQTRRRGGPGHRVWGAGLGIIPSPSIYSAPGEARLKNKIG